MLCSPEEATPLVEAALRLHQLQTMTSQLRGKSQSQDTAPDLHLARRRSVEAVANTHGYPPREHAAMLGENPQTGSITSSRNEAPRVVYPPPVRPTATKGKPSSLPCSTVTSGSGVPLSSHSSSQDKTRKDLTWHKSPPLPLQPISQNNPPLLQPISQIPPPNISKQQQDQPQDQPPTSSSKQQQQQMSQPPNSQQQQQKQPPNNIFHVMHLLRVPPDEHPSEDLHSQTRHFKFKSGKLMPLKRCTPQDSTGTKRVSIGTDNLP